MLSQKAKVLTARIADLERLHRQATQAQAFRTRVKKITDPAQRLSPLVKTLAQFRERGIQVDLPQQQIQAFQTRGAKLSDEFTANPSSIAGPDGEHRFTYWEPLKDLPLQVESALKKAWANHVQEMLPTGKSELLNALARLSSFSDHVQAIQDNQIAATLMAASLPGPTGFEELNRRATALRQSWDRLPRDEVSPEIMAFLQAASQRQATLQHVTPDVRAWLERHNLLKEFKVTL